MLKLKRFEHSECEKLNEFRKKFAPRNTKESGGIIINESGLYIFYEDGEPYDKLEQVAWLKEQIRGKKFEILQGHVQTKKFKSLFKELEGDVISRQDELDKLDKKDPGNKAIGNDIKSEIKSLEGRMKANEQMMIVSENNRQMSETDMHIHQEMLKEIEDGTIVV